MVSSSLQHSLFGSTCRLLSCPSLNPTLSPGRWLHLRLACYWLGQWIVHWYKDQTALGSLLFFQHRAWGDTSPASSWSCKIYDINWFQFLWLFWPFQNVRFSTLSIRCWIWTYMKGTAHLTHVENISYNAKEIKTIQILDEVFVKRGSFS